MSEGTGSDWREREKNFDPRLKKTALLVIDIQKNFWTENALVKSAFPDFPMKTSKLLSLCRDPKSEVSLIVHIRAVYAEEKGSAWMPYFRVLNPDKTDSAWNEAEEFATECTNAAGGPKEITVEKPTFDGFFNTNLENILKEADIKQVFSCGLITSACVQHTVHGAFARGFCPIVFEDCCGDRTVERHNAALSLYGGYMYQRATTDDLIAILDEDAY
jgi:maleamate amidohydrolase